jgi:hypothetical protein
MAAIARRAVLLAPLTLWAAGDARQEIVELLGDVASDLSSNNPNGIMKRVADGMPERDVFESHIRNLLASAQVATSVELREFAEQGGKATLTLDWFLEIRRDGFNNVLSTQRRRQLIRCSFAKEGKRWRFTSLQPVAFFAPPETQ